MKRLTWFLTCLLATATLTWAVAWWTVPIVAGIWTWMRREDAAGPLMAGAAACIAWGLLLAIATSQAPDGSVMTAVGRAMQVGPEALLGLTIAFPGLLAASAAAVVRAVAPPKRL